LHEAVGDELRAIPGVAEVLGLRFTHVPFEGKALGVKAYDEPTVVTAGKRYSRFDVQDRDPEAAGKELFHARDHEPTVFVSKNFTLHFKHKTGDLIELPTSNGMVKFRIVGVMTDFASPTGVVMMARTTYKRYFGDTLVSLFGVKLNAGFDTLVLRKAIDGRLGQKYNLTISANSELRSMVENAIDGSFAYTTAAEAAGLLVALFTLFNSMLTSVLDRTREFGVLRAVGTTRLQLARIIFLEAGCLGFFGALAAIGISALLAWFWIKFTMAYVLGWMVNFYFPWGSAATTLALGVLVPVIAAVYPVYRAARIEVVDALSFE
jgi:putative ABC transport system permease protein